MFRQDDLSQFFLGNSGPLKKQNEQRTQYFKDYEKSIGLQLGPFHRADRPPFLRKINAKIDILYRGV
jgi:hypothetical protein